MLKFGNRIYIRLPTVPLNGVYSDQDKLQLSVSIVLRVDHYVQYLVKCDVASFMMRFTFDSAGESIGKYNDRD
jgi:hypothetical protein